MSVVDRRDGGAFASRARSYKVWVAPCRSVPRTRIGVGRRIHLTRACGAFASGARSYRGGAGFSVLALEQAAIHEQRAIRRQLQAVAAAGDASRAAVVGEVWVGHVCVG